MSTVEVAERLARAAHVGQVDKRGRGYAEHHLAPVAALLRPFGPQAEAAGWLHDVLEDTDVNCETLTGAGNLTGLDALAVTDPGAAARLRTRYEAARRVLLVAVIG